jgi:hypothetical protein
MYSEPQTVTVNAVAKPLPRISFGDRKGIFEDSSAGLRLTFGHTVGRRNRHTERLDITKTAADPLLDGVSKQYSMSVTLVIDIPPVGFSPAEVNFNAKALLDHAGNPANLAKLVGGES